MSAVMALDELLSTYKDGDEHGWDTEFDYLVTEHKDRLATLIADVSRNGIKTPILLGSDGRIWDGHHRLAAAKVLGLKDVPVIHVEETPA